MDKDEEYTCKTFSLALPEGVNRADLPKLLEHFAEQIRQTSVKAVLDITFQNDIEDDGSETFNLTLYYK